MREINAGWVVETLSGSFTAQPASAIDAIALAARRLHPDANPARLGVTRRTAWAEDETSGVGMGTSMGMGMN